jgi:hypothetical protein|nr:MAG TPA: hypothetical protein [Caudoviricetes sp.]
MSHSKVDLIDYIGKLLSSNDEVVKTHAVVSVELQQVVSDEYHTADYDYRSDIRINYEKHIVDNGKAVYVPVSVRYDGGSIKAFDSTPSTGDFVDWFNEGYKKAMALYFPWFEKLKLRDLDIEGIHALCGNEEADGDIERKSGLAIANDPDGVYDHAFVFKFDVGHDYAPGTTMIERDRLGWNADTMKAMRKTLTGRADEFELKQSYVFKVGETNDNIIGDMAKQLMVNGTYNLLAAILYPAVNQPNSDTVDIEVKLQHVVAKGLRPKFYRLSYNGHLLGKTQVPYAVGLREILNDNHTSFKEADSLPLLPVFAGQGDDLRITHYKLDILVFKADAVKDSGALTPHEHPEGHGHGTTAPE